MQQTLNAGVRRNGANRFFEPSAAPGLSSAFTGAVKRLEDLIDLETRALQERRIADLQDFNHRKRHGLLELTRMMKPLEGIVATEDLRARLGSLRAKLEKNRSLLHLHLKAVQEISTIIARALQDAESDGTYSVSSVLGGKRQ